MTDLLIQPYDTGTANKMTLQGRLDAAGVDRIETRFVAAAVASRKDAAVDLSGVELITSMGLRLLIGAARSMSLNQKQLVLFGAQGMVLDVLETSAIDTLMKVVATESEARALLGV